MNISIKILKVSRFYKSQSVEKNYIILEKWGLGRSPKRGEGGSPTLSPGTDAGRVCPKALHDAEPTKHTQPFTEGKGFGVRDREFTLFFIKTDFFYKPRFYKSESHQQPFELNLLILTCYDPKHIKTAQFYSNCTKTLAICCRIQQKSRFFE